MSRQTGETTTDTDDTDSEAVTDDAVRRDDIPEDAEILQCGLVLDGDGGVLGRLHEENRHTDGTGWNE